jgi:hypothetical protein
VGDRQPREQRPDALLEFLGRGGGERADGADDADVDLAEHRVVQAGQEHVGVLLGRQPDGQVRLTRGDGRQPQGGARPPRAAGVAGRHRLGGAGQPGRQVGLELAGEVDVHVSSGGGGWASWHRP